MRVCFVVFATKVLFFQSQTTAIIAMQFDRNSIIAYRTHHMLDQLPGRDGQKGWAYYPQGFFGKWQPLGSKARRSMARPKRVTYRTAIGWIFDIEFRMMASRMDIRPVGVVYANSYLESIIPATNLVGTIGFLATTKEKRVKVRLVA